MSDGIVDFSSQEKESPQSENPNGEIVREGDGEGEEVTHPPIQRVYMFTDCDHLSFTHTTYLTQTFLFSYAVPHNKSGNKDFQHLRHNPSVSGACSTQPRNPPEVQGDTSQTNR